MSRDLGRKPRRVIIYCRISDDREGRRAGVGRQEADCRRLAAKLGWIVVAVYIENDMSAYSGKPRPKYLLMLDDLRAGEADAVIALAPTRLYRRIGDALEFLDLIASSDIAVQTVKAGRYNLDTADGRRDARRAAVDNQYESELISERVKDAKAETLAAGGYRGGPRPFGFESDGITVREEEAVHVRSATAAVIAGDSLRSIAAGLAAAGVRTVPRRYTQPDGTRGEPESRPWEPEQLRKLLLRPRNAGLIEHDGEIVGQAVWDALVDEESWRACVAILKNPDRTTTTSNARRWLGSGIFKCGVCQGPVKSSSTGKRGRTKALGKPGEFVAAYKCRKPSEGVHVTRLVVSLDEYVERVAVERLSRRDARKLLIAATPSEDPHGELSKQANALRVKLDGFTEDYDRDLITRAQFLKGTASARERLTIIEAQMATKRSKSVLASLPLGTPEIAEQWKGYHLDKKRAIIDAMMTVTLLPAKRGRPKGFKANPDGTPGVYFDTASVKIDWKEPA